jgi:hypothetical protein
MRGSESSGIAYSPNVSAGVSYNAGWSHFQKDFQFEISLSLRIENEKLSNWQIDEIRVLEEPNP